jgi:alkanesulfonate monooxygenase SsuD/methylene tetrahydromethanopterin reductase-like flavin-dependent oxidoreductase (luciferase family)
MMIVVAPTMEEAEADLAAIAAVKGWNDSVMDMARKALIFGDADSVGEQIADAMALGLDGITVDLPVNGHNLERVELLGQIAQKALD